LGVPEEQGGECVYLEEVEGSRGEAPGGEEGSGSHGSGEEVVHSKDGEEGLGGCHPTPGKPTQTASPGHLQTKAVRNANIRRIEPIPPVSAEKKKALEKYEEAMLDDGDDTDEEASLVASGGRGGRSKIRSKV